jgi:hypothetical protein
VAVTCRLCQTVTAWVSVPRNHSIPNQQGQVIGMLRNEKGNPKNGFPFEVLLLGCIQTRRFLRRRL